VRRTGLVEFLRLRSLSVVEFDFLSAYIELQGQLRSLETWRYIMGLRKLESDLYAASELDISNIIKHVITDLANSKKLVPKPNQESASADWRRAQRTVIRDEFQRMGFRSSLDISGSLVELDLASIVSEGRLESVLKEYVPKPQQQGRK
jgi:hypothetical protein